ncbi:hypothetical protein CYQ88_06190 [Hydrogenovibrio sp. SC-1]|uniref:phosphotransferase n=1 Tax=Hydrogenovibrio sp. SC-1 TaxID=2065820 RepID=UPI000C7E1877|nr:phosphotransferase [Hydrogenovibrio sp. SC-1]PLA74467.1 hypothetical protein CYQ88_06190 [Hydrogenovibrio sp. SC-1]
MQLIPPLYDPLRFLIIELQKQLELVTLFFETGEADVAERSLARVDYIDNYHLNLLNRAAAFLTEHPEPESRVAVQSYEHLNQSLKTLSRQCQAIVFQAQACRSTLKILRRKAVFKALQDLTAGLEMIEPAVESEGSSLAIDICRLKVHIDKRCDQQLDRLKKRLKKGQQTDVLLNASFVLRDISAMGEALLRIGEGIISANLGQMIQIERYHSLEATLTALELNPQQNELSIRALGETKSGCSLSGVMGADSEGEMLAVFKEGDQAKLQEEKTGIESWHQVYPGIAPKVYSYHKNGSKAALLFEYLTGDTFERLLLDKDRKLLKRGLNTLFGTLKNIWQETQAEEAQAAHYMQQLKKRLPAIFAVHPEFEHKMININGVKSHSIDNLIEACATIEDGLTVPNAVYIHGDFNLDNIIYDSVEDEVNFIDLHRSDYQDYVQDLSVLMVSCYRIANFDPKVRKLIAQTMQAIYDFGADYANQINDHSYTLRMALGLSRSFLTSTRFVLDKQHAKAMHFRARYLLEQIVRLSPQQLNHYQIPKEIFHD